MNLLERSVTRGDRDIQLSAKEVDTYVDLRDKLRLIASGPQAGVTEHPETPQPE